MVNTYRKGMLVRRPFKRLVSEEIKRLDKTSRQILEEIGILCFNEQAKRIFADNGCSVNRYDGHSHRIMIPQKIIDDALSTVPSKVKLGARDPNNSLILDAEASRIYFGSGSETNIWLDTRMETFVSEKDPGFKKSIPVFTEKRGSSGRRFYQRA